MHTTLRRFQPTPLGVVFIVSLAVLLTAAIVFVIGAIELLGIEGERPADVLPFARHLF